MEICKHHKPVRMGYVSHSLWMEARYKKGMRQKQCPDCKRWLYKDEMGKKLKGKK